MNASDELTKKEAWEIYKRARVTAGLCSPVWDRIFDQKAKRPQIGTTDPTTRTVEAIATIHRKIAFDDEDLLFNAPLYLRAAVFIAEGALAEIDRLKDQIEQMEKRAARRRQADDLARDCALACQRGDFARYLREKHGLEDIADAERVSSRVRSMLAISSRTELNTDPAAADRWRKLKSDFEAWRKV